MSGSMGISSLTVGREVGRREWVRALPVDCCPNAGGLDGCARKVEGACPGCLDERGVEGTREEDQVTKRAGACYVQQRKGTARLAYD